MTEATLVLGLAIAAGVLSGIAVVKSAGKHLVAWAGVALAIGLALIAT